MKKLLITFSILSAGALIAHAGANSVKPKYDEESWFGAKVTDNKLDEDRGKFVKGTASTVKVSDDNKIEIDSEFNDPVKFVLDDDTKALTSQFASVTFKLDPSVVPYSTLQTEELGDVKVAFALCEKEENSETVTNFYAWAAGKWNQLDFAIPTETYTLTMTFDESTPSEKKVQFSIGSETSEFPYTIGLGTPQINFVGSGKITQLTAAQLKLVSAEIDFTGGSVKIAGEDMDAMKALVGSGEDENTLEKVLVKLANSKFPSIVSTCNLTVAEAYAIGLIAKVGNEMKAKADGTFKVKADATATTTDGIKVGFVDTLTPNDKTAKITYKLMGSTTGVADSYTVIVQETKELDAIKIPTDKVTEGYRYFKVVTKVDLSK